MSTDVDAAEKLLDSPSGYRQSVVADFVAACH
jgi:hypothetical protein